MWDTPVIGSGVTSPRPPLSFFHCPPSFHRVQSAQAHLSHSVFTQCNIHTLSPNTKCLNV